MLPLFQKVITTIVSLLTALNLVKPAPVSLPTTENTNQALTSTQSLSSPQPMTDSVAAATSPKPTLIPLTNPILNQPIKVTIISPNNGSTVKKGSSISIEATVSDLTKVSKIVFGAGSDKHFPEIQTLTQPPFRFNYRIDENPYNFDDKNRHRITAYAYDKEGAYVTDTIYLSMQDPEMKLSLMKPSNDQTFKVSQTVEVEAAISGGKDVEKVEYYVGSGMLIKTLTEKPYSFQLNLTDYLNGITGKYNFPLEVRAYDTDGKYVRQSINLIIEP